MISAGGMKVAYRGIFRRNGEWGAGISWKETRIREKRVHQVEKNDARIRRAGTRNPLAVLWTIPSLRVSRLFMLRTGGACLLYTEEQFKTA